MPRKNIPGFNEESLIRNNFDYVLHIGFVKRIKSILPGAGVVKGFCTTMMIGELLEVLQSLLYPDDDNLFEQRLNSGMKSEDLGRRFASPRHSPKPAFQAISELEEEN